MSELSVTIYYSYYLLGEVSIESTIEDTLTIELCQKKKKWQQAQVKYLPLHKKTLNVIV